MSSNVFANGREISGKSGSNKSIAAMPDVCLSPPSPPAGPIPIPYPNTSMGSDTSKGSKKVKLKGKEAGLKNASNYKKSNGNQPATNSFGAGVVTHKLTGPSKHAAWSFDVKIEGQNAIRHMDLTTHNHMNMANSGSMTMDFGGMMAANPDDVECEAMSEGNTKARKDMAKDDRKTVKKVASENTTITHGKYTSPEGVSGVVKACSRALVSKYDNGFATGLTKADKKANRNAAGKVKSNACGGHVYNRADHMPHTSHTEARIIEDIFKGNPAGGGTLTLSIDWAKPPPGVSKKAPCKECKKLICAAAKCMTILICNEDDEPKKPKCP